MKILGVKVTGYCLLRDNFSLDLRTKARINQDDYEYEVLNIFKNVNIPSSIAFVGKNSSGKSTVFNLLVDCYTLLSSGQLKFKSREFSKDQINLSIVFGDNTGIFLYKLNILKSKDSIHSSLFGFSFCRFNNEELRQKNSSYKPNESLFEGFGENVLPSDVPVDGRVVTILSEKYSFSFDFYPIFSSQSSKLSPHLYLEHFKELPSDLKGDLIKLLDDSIIKIDKIPDTDDYFFQRRGMEEQRISGYDLNSILSDGTKRGIQLFTLAFYALKTGGTLLVDEIEGSFHKNLVSNVIFLFNDNQINTKKANLMFTTHYSEILDSFRRRDSIYVCHRGDDGIGLKNVYSDFSSRCELSKSKQFNNNVFGTLLNYYTMSKIRDEVKNEISDSN